MGKNQSKLPFVVWPTKEEEQVKALETSEQLAEFRAYREKIRNHPHTPHYHFCAPNGNINDPNGFCRWNGKYHLFYQQYPPVDSRQHWGHAVSDDLVRWQDLPTAIYPDPEEAVYSGSALAEDGRVLAMYHGLGVGNFIAESRDPMLLNWEKLTGDAVIKPADVEPYGVFDPFLWHGKDGYYSLSGVTRKTEYGPRMTEELFRSDDLVHWKHVDSLMEENPFLGTWEDGACPYFIPAKDGEWFLFHFSHNSGPHIYTGIYDETTHKYKPHHHIHPATEAPGAGTLHAPCAISDGEGGAYVIYNCTDGCHELPDYPRTGMMSMVYHVTLGYFKEPRIEPLGVYDTLHDALLCDTSLTVGTDPAVLPARGKYLDIQMKLDVKQAAGFELRVLHSEKESTLIRFTERSNTWRDRAYILVDTMRSSLDPHVFGKSPELIQICGSNDGKIDVRVLLDGCMLEVFVSGMVVFSTAYPTLPESDKLTLSALGGTVTADSLKVWSMKQIY